MHGCEFGGLLLRRDVGLKVSGWEMSGNGFAGLEVRGSGSGRGLPAGGGEKYIESSWFMESASDPRCHNGLQHVP